MDKVTLSLGELQEIVEQMESCKKMTGKKFAYAVARNQDRLKRELRILQDVSHPEQPFIEYNEERIKLCKEYSAKDHEGKPVMILNGPKSSSYFIEDQEAFDKALDVLQEEHKDALDAEKKRIAEHVELLKQEIEIEPYAIRIDWVPNNISVEQMEAIFPFIDGDFDDEDAVDERSDTEIEDEEHHRE